MLKKRKGEYATILILLVVAALLLISCQSSPETIIVEKTTLPPPVSFPVPPDPAGRVEYLDNGDVKIDGELWVQFAEYMIDVEATREKYLKIREEYSDK